MEVKIRIILQHAPFWSDIQGLLNSLVGKSATLLAVTMPIANIIPIPSLIKESLQYSASGAVLILAANVLYSLKAPALQKYFPSLNQYETRCIELTDTDSLDLYEEFDVVVGKHVNRDLWNRSGASFVYLNGKNVVPSVDEYKTHFHNSQKKTLNRKKMARSMATIKYLVFDSSMYISRATITISLLVGMLLLYSSVLLGTIKLLFKG